MKRMIASLVCITVLLSLFACSSPAKVEEKTTEEVTAAELSPAEYYAAAVEKMALLTSYELETLVSDGESTVTWNTCRVREGYDRFSFSRTKKGSSDGLYFNGDTTWTVSPEGNYSAPATTVSFQSFLEQTAFPVCGLDMTQFGRVERDGDTVRYAEAGEAARAAFSGLSDMTVTGVEGEAVIENDLLREEEIRVTGTAPDGSTRLVTLNTRMVSHGEKNVTAATVPAVLPVMNVNDIRLPTLLRGAYNALLSGDNVSLTAVSEESAADVVRSVSIVFNGVNEDYSLRRTEYLKDARLAEAETEENADAETAADPADTEPLSSEKRTETFLLVKDKTLRVIVTDGNTIAGDVRSDGTYPLSSEVAFLEDGTIVAPSSHGALALMFPRLENFATAELTEDVREYRVAFSLSEAASHLLINGILEGLKVEAPGDLSGLTVKGELSFDKDGTQLSLFYQIENETGAQPAVSCRFSCAAFFGDAALEEPQSPPPADLED